MEEIFVYAHIEWQIDSHESLQDQCCRSGTKSIDVKARGLEIVFFTVEEKYENDPFFKLSPLKNMFG